MRPIRGAVWGCALVLLAVEAGTSHAAWCNVFQVCCNSCGGYSASAPPAADPCGTPCCPQQTCTTRYVQRTYYQPVTSYQTRTYYEPVTTYRTSYYYEPVTSYRYSCYVDPCTGCSQQVACPVTSYQLRSQCCPVQSWTQRCCQVPVTTYQQSCYWEPVTSCCSNPCPCPPPCSTTPAPTTPAQVPTTAPPSGTPGVQEGVSGGTPGVREGTDTGTSNKPFDLYRKPQDTVPGTGFQRQVAPQGQVAPRTAPTVRMDHIVLGTSRGVEGQVVRYDHGPLSGARILFVSADRQGAQHTVTADATGQFRISLASGGWLVYVTGADGKAIYNSKIQVREDEPRQLTLVSR